MKEGAVFVVEVQRAFRVSRYPREVNSCEWLGEFERVVARLRVACERVSGPGGKSIEFGLLEQVLERVVSDLDNRRLATMEVFSKRPPSLENLAMFIYNKLEILLAHTGARPYEVSLELPGLRHVTYQKGTA